MPEQEKLRCNICDTTVDAGAAKDHASMQSHAEKKARLENELAASAAVRAKRTYSDDDDSVASRWSGTISQ
jgi:hypothetical protein